LWISSIEYNNRRDGIAINTRMTAGAVVQMVSVICPSRMNRLVCLIWMIHIQWVPVALSPGVKHPVCEVNNSPPISVKVKNEWSYTFDHPICLHGVDGDILYIRTNICVCFPSTEA